MNTSLMLTIFYSWAGMSFLACSWLLLRAWVRWRRPEDPERFRYHCDCCEEMDHAQDAVASQRWEGATVCPPCADVERHGAPWALGPESNLRRFVAIRNGSEA